MYLLERDMQDITGKGERGQIGGEESEVNKKMMKNIEKGTDSNIKKILDLLIDNGRILDELKYYMKNLKG